MSKRLRTVVIAVAVVASVFGGAWSPAVAGGIFRTDGNDTAGPLDLASVRLTPIKDGDRFEIRTLTAFTSGQLNGDDGWIEVDFDTNADRDYEAWVVVYYYKGKLVAVNGHGSKAIRALPVRRVDKRTVSFDIKHLYVGNGGSYDFVVYSIWRGAPCGAKDCVDTIPNRYPLIRHDFTAPMVIGSSLPQFSTDTSNTLTFPVFFKIKDDQYGSGLKNWTLQARSDQTSTWSAVGHGTKATPTVPVTGQEGGRYRFRVLVIDKQGNKRSESLLGVTNVPLDDRNPVMQFTTAIQVARLSAFLGTITQIPNGESVSVTFTTTIGMFCYIVGPPVTPGTLASADVKIDNTDVGSITLGDVTADLSKICTSVGVGDHTLTLTGTTAEPFVIDGLIAP